MTIDEAVDLRFVERALRPASEEEEIELEADDCDEIDFAGDMFDLGEAVAQTLGLAIDPYAEGPERRRRAERPPGSSRKASRTGRMAAMLAALKKP